MVVESLLTLLGTPYPDAVSYKPFYDKWRFICDASDTVEHEHQQNIKFALSGVFLDDLQLVTGFCADFVARHAFFLFFMDDDPALCFGKFVTRLALHGKVCFMVRVEIHLLIGGNTVQAANSFAQSHAPLRLERPNVAVFQNRSDGGHGIISRKRRESEMHMESIYLQCYHVFRSGHSLFLLL